MQLYLRKRSHQRLLGHTLMQVQLGTSIFEIHEVGSFHYPSVGDIKTRDDTHVSHVQTQHALDLPLWL